MADCSVCSVCQIRNTKTGKHYGAVSCYSCRAFFRRVPERKRPPRCKFSGLCPVDQVANKQCPGCRYQKCVRVGMQPALVLNEEEKKERFKVSLEKKKKDAKVPQMVSSENRFTGVNHNADFSQSTDLSSAVSPSHDMKPFSPERFVRYDHRPIVTVAPMQNYSKPLTTSSSLPMFSTQPSVMSTKLEGITEDPMSNIFQNSSSIYPNTTFYPPCQQSFNQLSTRNCSRNLFSQSFIEKKLCVRSEESRDIKENFGEIQRNVNFKNTSLDARKSVIQVNELENMDILTSDAKYDTIELKPNTQDQEMLDTNDDDMYDLQPNEKYLDHKLIQKYINDKFAAKNCDIAKDSITSSSEIVNRNRKSVIVPNCSSKFQQIGNDIMITEETCESFLEDESDDIIVDETVIKVKLDGDIDILAINSLCTKYLIQEENNYLNTIKTTFEIAWHEINLGQDIMEDYIRFCHTRGDISYQYFESLNKKFRERFLNFICSLNLPEEISLQSAYKMFSENLSRAEMLTYVYVFNVTNWAVEVDFLLGNGDKAQWNARGPGISGTSITILMHYLMVPEQTKLAIYTELYSYMMPILQDKTVWILMVLLTIFDQEGVAKIKQLRESFFTILSRYLEENTKSSVSLARQNIIHCISALPRVHKLFREMKKNCSRQGPYTQ